MEYYEQINSFSFPTNIRFGAGAVKELPAYLKDNDLSRPLIVTDPVVKDLPFFKKIVEDLIGKGIHVGVFSDISKNPVKSDVLKGGDAYADHKADSVIGIGGGAGMDVARAVVLRVNHRRDLFDYDDLEGGAKYVTEAVPHFITVPTTSGTGSEVGRSAIISENDTKRKRILFHPKLLAKQVFADPELTYGLPPAVTAATGMDALTHNVEAYLAKGWHPMADGIALEGVKLISHSLERAVRKSDPKSRADMMMGSLMGAVAFQKGLGIVHSLAHPLSTLVDMHHGLANAIMIPYGMEFNMGGMKSKFRPLSRAMGLGNGQGKDVVEHLFELNGILGIPSRLDRAGVKAEQLEELSKLAFADFCHPSNPKPVTQKDFLKIYKLAFKG